MQNSTPSVVILISGRGSNLNALIDHAKQTGAYQIRAVISNRPAAAGLALAQSAGLETAILDHTEYESREAFDAALAEAVDDGGADATAATADAAAANPLTAGWSGPYGGVPPFDKVKVAGVSFPIAIGLALLRYRLYDLDLVVNRDGLGAGCQSSQRHVFDHALTERADGRMRRMGRHREDPLEPKVAGPSMLGSGRPDRHG